MSQPNQSPLRPARWWRIVLTSLVLPLLLMSVFGLCAAYRIYAGNRSEDQVRRFTAVSTPVHAQRLLVIAPHCDDETLGAGGLMRQARAARADVHVVVISNGDGFRVGVQREYKTLRVSPADYIRYAYHRQGESRAAMQVLGVPADHVAFLGYPDRGLMSMWTTHWADAQPFLSSYTQTDHSPYTDSPTPRAPYAGESLLRDLTRQMQADRPTDIYVTHPNDDHPDHAAASVFVQTALADLKAQGQPWAQHARLHYYLVHRGDWPCPQGLHENYPLPPPASMADLDTHWEQLSLSKSDVQKKYAAILSYPSQTELTGRFLFSFARMSELFGTLPGAQIATLPYVPDGRITLSGTSAEWRGIVPAALDPVGDTVLRAFQASGDITRLFACRDSRFLYLRLDTRQRLSSRVTYRLSLRPLTLDSSPPAFQSLDVSPGAEGHISAVSGFAGAWSCRHGNSLEVRLPLADAGLAVPRPHETLSVSGETRFSGILIDHTGYRTLACDPVPARTASR